MIHRMNRLQLRKSLAVAAWAAVLAAAGCAHRPVTDYSATQRIADRAAIEDVLSRANLGFELSDPDLFAGAFAEDAVYQLDEKGPVFGYAKLIYRGRADIRTIITDRLDRVRRTNPKTLSYDPATLRRYNRNSDDRIVILDARTAHHSSTWMVVMKTNVNIHISAVGRYEDELDKRNGKWFIVKRVRTE
ncbi:MAG: nuclear transport factor 2 family protein [Steroidobacteraceae bacterium]